MSRSSQSTPVSSETVSIMSYLVPKGSSKAPEDEPKKPRIKLRPLVTKSQIGDSQRAKSPEGVQRSSEGESHKDINVTKMRSFADLSTSPDLADRLIHSFVVSTAEKLLGASSGEMIIDTSLETEENHKFIRDNWMFIRKYLEVPSRIKATQYLVKGTFKYLIDQLNGKYGFQSPMKLTARKRKLHNTTYSYNILTF